jgi:hypothetical protein
MSNSQLCTSILIALMALAIANSALARPSESFTYEGYLEDSLGNPATGPIHFRFTIHDGASCDLWQKEVSNVSPDNGYFSIDIGAPATTSNLSSLTQVFANQTPINCFPSGSVTLTAGTARQMRVEICDDSTFSNCGSSSPWNTLGDQTINSAPSALLCDSAYYLGSKTSTDFVQFWTNASRPVTPQIGEVGFNTDQMAFEEYSSGWTPVAFLGTVTSVTGTAPVQVTNGTTTPSISIDDATASTKGVVQVGSGLDVSSGVVSLQYDSSQFTINGSNELELSATYLTSSDAIAGDVTGTIGASTVSSIQGEAVDATAPGAGQALLYNGVSYSPTAVLPLSGGTMTGGIDMNSETISNLPVPLAGGDAATMAWVNTQVDTIIDDATSANDNFIPKFNNGATSITDSKITDDGSTVAIGTNKLVVLSSGNVGIGTTTPDTTLDVTGSSSSFAFLPAGNADPSGSLNTSQWSLWFDEANDEFELVGKKSDDSLINVTVGSGGGGTGDIEGVAAGAGLSGGATSGTATLAHDDTSTQTDVDNSDGNIIQDLTFDGFGHVTGAVSTDLDTRYFTQSTSDVRYLKLAGGTMLGALNMGANTITSSATPTGVNDLTNKTYVDDGLATKSDSGHTHATYLEKAGGTTSGPITMNGTLTMGANINMGNSTQTVTGLPDPANADDAVNLNYFEKKLGIWDLDNTVTPPSDGQVLKWSTTNTRWELGNDNAGGGAGDGHSLDADDGAPTDALYVDATGEVGIGTITPTAKFHVIGTANITGVTNFSDDLIVDSTDLFVDKSLNRVGIGTSSPSTKLTVYGNSVDAITYMRLSGNDNAGIRMGQDGENYQISYNPFDNYLKFSTGTGATTRMVLTNLGNLGIGLTNPSSPLEVSGNIEAEQICYTDGTNCLDLSLGVPAMTGTSASSVMQNSSIPNCSSTEKLQMSLGPVHTFTCEPDNDSGGDITSVVAGTGITVDSGTSGDATVRIGAGAITATEIAGGAVGTSEIADGSISNADLDDDSITANKINTGAVTTDGIANLTITTADIADGQITSAKIANGAVTDAKISGTITASKIGVDSRYVAATGDTMTGALTITAGGTGLNVNNDVDVGGNLEVSGDTLTSRLHIQNYGTATQPSIALDNDGNSGIYAAADNGVYISAGGANVVNITPETFRTTASIRRKIRFIPEVGGTTVNANDHVIIMEEQNTTNDLTIPTSLCDAADDNGRELIITHSGSGAPLTIVTSTAISPPGAVSVPSGDSKTLHCFNSKWYY